MELEGNELLISLGILISILTFIFLTLISPRRIAVHSRGVRVGDSFYPWPAVSEINASNNFLALPARNIHIKIRKSAGKFINERIFPENTEKCLELLKIHTKDSFGLEKIKVEQKGRSNIVLLVFLLLFILLLIFELGVVYYYVLKK